MTGLGWHWWQLRERLSALRHWVPFIWQLGGERYTAQYFDWYLLEYLRRYLAWVDVGGVPPLRRARAACERPCDGDDWRWEVIPPLCSALEDYLLMQWDDLCDALENYLLMQWDD